MLRKLLTAGRLKAMAAVVLAGAVTLTVFALLPQRHTHTQLQQAEYLAALSTARRLASEYESRCPRTAPTTENICREAVSQAAALRNANRFYDSTRALVSAPKGCWCDPHFRSQLRRTEDARQLFERKHGWEWGPLGEKQAVSVSSSDERPGTEN